MVKGLLAPGGRLHLVEFHPITEVFADETLEVVYGYFHQGPRDWPIDEGSYADFEARTEHNATVEFAHASGCR